MDYINLKMILVRLTSSTRYVNELLSIFNNSTVNKYKTVTINIVTVKIVLEPQQYINALKLSTKHCIPSSVASTKCYIVPGWNEYAKEHHIHAKDALWWWNLYNRPRHGLIYDNMRKPRAHFKYALRFVKKQEGTAKADALARD